ncbi:MAG TPA: hypothetical protein DDZ68_12875 [Parvularcula sp.]|nr:hypothetical protein [Parvularcula sp.]
MITVEKEPARAFYIVESANREDDLCDPLKAMHDVIDFDAFRPTLIHALEGPNASKGGWRAFDPVMMFKVLILEALNDLSDERAEFLIKDRLCYMRLLGLSPGERTPDRNTIRSFREALKKADVIDSLFAAFDAAITATGNQATYGHLVDATLVRVRHQDWSCSTHSPS